MEDIKQELEIAEEKLITIEELRENEYKCDDIKVEKYISFASKQVMIDGIMAGCIIQDGSMKKIDYAISTFLLEFSLISQYSNIDCNVEEVSDFYDELKENRIVDFILNKIPQEEVNFIQDILYRELTQKVQLENSLENILAKGIESLLLKIPSPKEINSIIKAIPKIVNKIDKDNLKIITESIGLNNLNMGKK